MKTLNFEQMEQVNGGWVWDALGCAGSIGAMVGAVKLLPVTGAITIGRANEKD